MSVSTAVRGKTGEKCPTSGIWAFDGYLDGTSVPAPTAAEREIALSVPNVFPPIKSSGKACWWKLVRRS